MQSTRTGSKCWATSTAPPKATSATASSSGGASSERVALSDFKIRKAVDKASAKLFEHCCTGKHIAKLKLNVNRAGGDKVTYLTIDMEEVVVSSVRFVAGGNQVVKTRL